MPEPPSSIPPQIANSPRRAYRAWVPLLVLAVGLIATAVGTTQVAISTRARERLRFENGVQHTRDAIAAQLDTYIALLRGTQGLFASSDEVTYKEFRTYIDHLELNTRFPGLQGIGFSERIEPGEESAVVAGQLASGIEGFHFWPEKQRDDRHAIIYIEPLDWRNRRAMGYDMFSEPVRRAAMEKARDTGLAAASGKVHLVQETDHEPQAGFLIYLPIYSGQNVPDSLEQRRARLQGFVYAPIRIGDLLRGTFGQISSLPVSFGLYDLAPVDVNLFQDTLALSSSGVSSPSALSAQVKMTVAGRPWVLLASPRDAEEHSAFQLSLLTALTGLALSLLLYGATGWLARAKASAERTSTELLAQSVERRRAEAALRDSEARLRAMFNQAGAGIALIGPDGNFEQVNQRYCEIVGYSAAEMTELTWQSLTYPEDLDGNLQLVRKVLDGELPNVTVEKRYLRKDGQIAWVSVSTSLVRDAGGGPEHTINVIQDIAARKQAEQTVFEQKRELEDFVSIVAHDLRHPVVSVQGLLGILRKEIGATLDPDGRENLSLALAECNRMKDIIAQLGNIARIGSSDIRWEDTPVRGLLNRVVHRFAELIKHRRAEVHIDCPNLRATFARAQIEEALDNLVENALQYGCAGETPIVTLSCRAETDGLLITVGDAGPGIESRFHKRVFELFRRLDPQGPIPGTGVGLTAVQRLIRRIGGTITLESESGRGARFTLRFPAREIAEVA